MLLVLACLAVSLGAVQARPAVVALAASSSSAPASSTPASAEGALPYSATSAYTTPSPTSIALQPTPTANGTAEVAALWKLVEAEIPVQTAAVTTLQAVPANYSFGPDPPSYYETAYPRPDTENLTLPEGFLYGVASASAQVEGAAKADGRGPSTWDYLCHTYPSQCNNFAPDVTTNHYYQYPVDLARIKHLGVTAYSFSLSWSRIYPLGTGAVNEPGLAYYDAFIDEIAKNDITPVLTIFHWDAPLALLLKYGAWQDIGDSIVNDYVAYATTVFKRYGQKVKHYVTFNEPRVYCSQTGQLPYNTSYPIGVNETSAQYRCTYNILRAHGQAVKVFRELLASGEIAAGSIIGFKNDDNYPLPAREGNKDDEESAERHGDFRIGIFASPVYGTGDYPTSVKETLGDLLPALSDADKALIKGSADFFALDGYRTDISRAALNGIANCAANSSDPNWPICEEGADAYVHAYPSGWAIGQSADPLSSWLVNSAPFVRRQIKLLHAKFPAKAFIFSEFGFAEPFEYLRTELYQITWDGLRTQYYRDYLNALLLSIHEDGMNIIGCFAWSFLDNFEWALGLEQKFGMQYVNQSSPDLTRTYKLSAFQYRDWGRQHLAKN